MRAYTSIQFIERAVLEEVGLMHRGGQAEKNWKGSCHLEWLASPAHLKLRLTVTWYELP